MTTGTSPSLPESGWKVLHEDALRSWLLGKPSTLLIRPVIEWIRAVEAMGPPPNAILVASPDRYIAPIEGTRVAIDYLLIEYEFLVIIRKIQ